MKITYTPHINLERKRYLEKFERLQVENGWIPVKYGLPEEQEKVLVYGNGEFMINSVQDGRWYLYMDTITHWKPLIFEGEE